jgi:hypothetical protein
MKKKLHISTVYRILQGLTLLVLATSFYLSYVYFPADTYWYYFFLNITTDTVVLLFATFVIEKGIETYKVAEEERKWLSARKYAHRDIGNLSRGLAATVLLYTKTEFTASQASGHTKEGYAYVLEKIEHIHEEHSHTFFKLLLEKGEEVKKVITRDKVDLESTITLYKDIVPPHLLQRLWSVRSALNRLTIVVTETHDILKLIEGKESSAATDGIPEWAMKTCTASLDGYIHSLTKLLKVIGREEDRL